MAKMGKIVIVVWTLVCVVALQSCSDPEKDKLKYYKSALDYIENDNHEAAILQLQNAIQADAKYGEAHYRLGLLYLEVKESQKAFHSLLRAADLDSANLDANYHVARFYFLNRQIDECRVRVEQILNTDSRHRDTLVLLANIELVEGNYDAALAALEAIGEDVDSSAELLNIKGRIYALREKWDEAEVAFKESISMEEDNLGFYHSLLLLYQNAEKKDKAQNLLEQMVRKFPDNIEVRQLLVNFFLSTGDVKSAEKVYREIIVIDTDNPTHRLQLAKFLRGQGRNKIAEKILLEAYEELADKTNIIAALATLYFDEGQLDKAQKLLDELLVLEPRHGAGKLLKARFTYKEGAQSDAMVLLSELNKEFPDWSEPYYYLGLGHYSLGEIDLAKNAVSVAIKKYSRSAKYHTLLAQILQIQGDFEEAQKEALIALKINPKNIRSAIILSRALIDLKRFEQAIKLLTNMNGQVPNNKEILGNLALAFRGNNEKAEAITTLKLLLDIYPGNFDAIVLLLELKFRTDYRGREAFIREQLSISDTDIRLFLLLGDALVRQGKQKEAIELYEEAIQSIPSDHRIYLANAKLLRSLGENEDAERNYKKALEYQPNSVAPHMGLAELAQLNGNIDKAKEYYREILKIRENYVPAWNNLAWLIASDENGDLGEALMLAMQAKQDAPDSPVIADTLGWVHLKRGSYSLAIVQFELALEKMPQNPTMKYHLAQAYIGVGENMEAIEILEQLLREDISFPEREEAELLLKEQKSVSR